MEVMMTKLRWDWWERTRTKEGLNSIRDTNPNTVMTKRDLKEANEEAETAKIAALVQQGRLLKCTQRENKFSSRNKLFKHLKQQVT